MVYALSNDNLRRTVLILGMGLADAHHWLVNRPGVLPEPARCPIGAATVAEST